MKRNPAGRHFIKHGAEREQIGARIQFLGSDLLRRHIGHRAEHRPRAGEMLCFGGESFGIMTARSRCDHFRQTEVENLCMATLGDEYICRFDIAVDDPFL